MLGSARRDVDLILTHGIRRCPAYDDLFIYLFGQGDGLYLVEITLQQVTVNSSSVCFLSLTLCDTSVSLFVCRFYN